MPVMGIELDLVDFSNTLPIGFRLSIIHCRTPLSDGDRGGDSGGINTKRNRACDDWPGVVVNGERTTTIPPDFFWNQLSGNGKV